MTCVSDDAAANTEEEGGNSDIGGTTPPINDRVWNKSAKELVDKTEEEEFDDYFKDMLL